MHQEQFLMNIRSQPLVKTFDKALAMIMVETDLKQTQREFNSRDRIKETLSHLGG